MTDSAATTSGTPDTSDPTSYFDIEQFQQLLDKLEASKGRQTRQEALEDRRNQFAAGIANVMSNF